MKIKIYILSLFLLTVLAVGFVSAADDNSTLSCDIPLESTESEAISVDLDNDTVSEDNYEEGYLDPTEAYECLNEFRTSKGVWYWAADDENIIYFNTNEDNQLQPLSIDDGLVEVAKIRAKEITIHFEHERPDGSLLQPLYENLTGYHYFGENLAFSYFTGKDATDAWKESYQPFSGQGHRRGMLDPQINCVGIAGYITSDGVPFWVQAFGYNGIPTVHNKTNRTYDGTKSSFKDLSDLISKNTIIQLDCDYEYKNESDFAKGILIDRQVTIDGCGHSIDAKKLTRIFNITADNVILKNIQFTNVYIDYANGGAILTNKNLTLINCSFSDNFAYYGSAVYSTGESLTLNDCKFTGNYAVKSAVYKDNGKITIENCRFNSNSAILYGGAMCLNYADVTLTNSIFTDNSASNRGGAVFLVQCNVSNRNCSFTSNSLNPDGMACGGALCAEDSNISFVECRFSQNRMNSYFRYAYGGAFYLIDGNVSIVGCNFTDNFAMDFGGAICLVNNPATILECSFKDNSLKRGSHISNGGAIYAEGKNITIEKSTFLANTAENGASIALRDIDVSLENCSFTDNLAGYNSAVFSNNVNMTVLGCVFSNNTCRFNGGAIYLRDGKLSVYNSTFTKNNGTYGGALRFENAEILIKNNLFKDNTVDYEYTTYGGAIYLVACRGQVELCNFTQNKGFSQNYVCYGAALYCENIYVDVSDCRFSRNLAYNGVVHSKGGNLTLMNCDFADEDIEGSGIIYLDNISSRISDCRFTNISIGNSVVYLFKGVLSVDNSGFYNIYAKFSGGAIQAYEGEVSIINDAFSNISGSSQYNKNGGAVFLSLCNLSISNSNFTDISASGYGGAVYLRGCHGSIDSSRFANITLNSTGFNAYGGGLYSTNGNMTISDCNFSDIFLNSSYYAQGGALALINDNSSVMNCIFTDNSAAAYSYGGAVYCDGCNAIITKGVFVGNTANIGGAVASRNGNVSISNSIFQNNSAQQEAGAIYLDNSNSSLSISDFSNNHALYGGAISSYQSCQLVTDCEFLNNSAILGGAIYSSWANVDVISSNFTNNSASSCGGALYCCNAVNSIFTQNKADTAGAIYGDNNNASKCKFIENVAYKDNPTYSVNNKDCTFIDNRLITRALISVPYLEDKYYQGDMLYVNVFNQNDHQFITNATVTVRVYRDNVFVKSFDFSSGEFGWIVNVSNGTYFAVFTIEDDAFESDSVNITFNVSQKQIAVLDVNVSKGTYSYPATVDLASNVDANAEVYIDGYYVDYVNVAGGESKKLTYYNLAAGNHSLVFELTPLNSKIDPIRTVKSFEVLRKPTSLVLDVNDSTTVDDVVVNVCASENGNVFVTIGNLTEESYVYANQTFQFYFGALASGIYDVSASFTAGENYLNSSTSKSISIKKVTGEANMTVLNFTYGETVVVDLISNADAGVEIYIDGAYVEYINIWGNVKKQLKYYSIDAGTHSLKAVFVPLNSLIPQMTEIRQFEVYKKETSLSIEVKNTTSDEDVIVCVLASENGNVAVKIENLARNVNVEANKTTEISFGALASGIYDVSASFTAGENYLKSNASATLKVLSKITQNDVKISKSNSSTIAVSLPADASGNATLSIAGNVYSAVVDGGVVKFNLSGLADGDYPYTITYGGDEKYSGFLIAGNFNTASSNPTIKPDIAIPPLSTDNQVKLPGDAKGNVTLSINGKNYVFDVINGVASVELPKLANGNYAYTITYSGDAKYSSVAHSGNLVVARPLVISASNVKLAYTESYYYKIVVKNDVGMAAGQVEVTVRQNGKAFKTLTTDSNGICKFKVSQVPGTYKLTISCLKTSVAKTLTVKHILTLKKVTVKKSAKKLVLTASLAKVNKKYLKNKKITFKFNGKKYTAKTNKKGVAKLTIKKTVLKKLKVGKKITYQATYLKDTVKRTIKVKK